MGGEGRGGGRMGWLSIAREGGGGRLGRVLLGGAG